LAHLLAEHTIDATSIQAIQTGGTILNKALKERIKEKLPHVKDIAIVRIYLVELHFVESKFFMALNNLIPYSYMDSLKL